MQIFTSEHISQQCNLFSVTETDAVYRNIDLTNFLYYNSYMSTDFVVLLRTVWKFKNFSATEKFYVKSIVKLLNFKPLNKMVQIH